MRDADDGIQNGRKFVQTYLSKDTEDGRLLNPFPQSLSASLKFFSLCAFDKS